MGNRRCIRFSVRENDVCCKRTHTKEHKQNALIERIWRATKNALQQTTVTIDPFWKKVASTTTQGEQEDRHVRDKGMYSKQNMDS